MAKLNLGIQEVSTKNQFKEGYLEKENSNIFESFSCFAPKCSFHLFFIFPPNQFSLNIILFVVYIPGYMVYLCEITSSVQKSVFNTLVTPKIIIPWHC